MFYIDLNNDNLNRFDFSRFAEGLNDTRDVLTSYFLSRIKQVPTGGIFKVVREENRPDLISYALYGSTQYWWVILYYNDMIDVEEIVTGSEIKYPLLSDLESVYYELVSKSLIARNDESAAIALSTITGGDQQVEIVPPSAEITYNTTYLHIAYADSIDGDGFSKSPEGKTFIGMYTDLNPTDSTDPHAYIWITFRGPAGEPGAPGEPGPPGLSGQDAITVSLSNATHTIPSDSNGDNCIYDHSGTIITVYEGSTKMVYNGVGVTDFTWTVSATGNGITPGAITKDSVYAVVAEASTITGDTASIDYQITGVNSIGVPFSLLKTQTFAKSKSGGVEYSVTVESTNGTVFRPGQTKTTMLIAHVFKNGEEVTDQLDPLQFCWRRVSYYDNPAGDAQWNNEYASGYKQISLTINSVDSMATFHCDIVQLN